MKWLIAGLLFALAVGLAVGTAGIRAENVVARRNVEQQYRAINDRQKELDRLWFQRLQSIARPMELTQLLGPAKQLGQLLCRPVCKTEKVLGHGCYLSRFDDPPGPLRGPAESPPPSHR